MSLMVNCGDLLLLASASSWNAGCLLMSGLTESRTLTSDMPSPFWTLYFYLFPTSTFPWAFSSMVSDTLLNTPILYASRCLSPSASTGSKSMLGTR